MLRVPNHRTPTARARWLAELAQALEEARTLVRRIKLSRAGDLGVIELQMRIDAARLEVESLRLGSTMLEEREPDPKWTRSLPWQQGSAFRA